MKKIISPSLLSADFLSLGEELDMINKSRAEWVHLDIMDGMFVPNITYGQPIVKAIRKRTNRVLDVHLMVEKPERYIDSFIEAGADYLTVHVEASTHLHRTLQSIKAQGVKAGIALNPHTPLCTIEEVLEMADMVLIMAVNPGFGGQKFIQSSLDKVSRLKEMILKRNINTIIEVDGGVTTDNAAQIYGAGADVLVAGNAVFNSPDPTLSIEKILV